MSAPVTEPLELPQHWTPEQALAVFQIIERLRDRLWADYGPAIQRALRQDQRNADSPSLHIPLDDPPF
jgi:ribosomal 50S subunit-associated protein YjgA (DUF615 family)